MTSTINRLREMIKSGIKPSKVKRAKKTNEIDSKEFYELVGKKAYELYEKRGCVDGCDLQDWLEAERIVEQDIISDNSWLKDY